MSESEAPAIDIHRLLQTMVEQGASDLHLTAESPPALRINGNLYPLKTRPLTGREVEKLAHSILNEVQKKTFDDLSEIDLSFRWRNKSRFRANFFRQKGYVAGAIRMIPTEARPLSQLGLPSSVDGLVKRPNGLVLVTGPTGSGKSTTLASMVDAINSTHRGHIITIEDPIEFVHSHKKCIVNQREVGADTHGFANALRYILRQDPDVVLVGEIRDLETMEATLRIAETGHLALATLHTNNAIQTIHRILDFFPARQQDMVRTQLSFVLEGVISQQLLARQDGQGRVLACEVLIANSAIRNLIREDKTHQIYSHLQMGQGKHGMMTFNQSLFGHVQTRAITRDQALDKSHDVDELETMLSKLVGGGGVSSGSSAGGPNKRRGR
jgi:twitching motility protein PilT